MSRRGRSAICAWSVKVSASSKMMTFGPVETKRESKEERIKGYTRPLTASNPRSSLEFKKRALPKKEEDFYDFTAAPWRAWTNILADVVLPDPGGPIKRRWERAWGDSTIVCKIFSILYGNPRPFIIVRYSWGFRP